MNSHRMIWIVAALCAGVVQANAQARLLPLHQMNFDMWCQEHQHLPADRCDKRLPQDDAAFQAYANTIERYETQKLNNEAKERHIERMMNADPLDNPVRPSTPAGPQPQQ
jgi:hypothetical protein